MISQSTEEDEPTAASHFQVIEKWSNAWMRFQARRRAQAKARAERLAEEKARAIVAKANKEFEKLEEMKYYLTQRHRKAIVALHDTPKARLIDKHFFMTMNALAAIEKSNQTTAQKLEHQRIALQSCKRMIKSIIAGRASADEAS